MSNYYSNITSKSLIFWNSTYILLFRSLVLFLSHIITTFVWHCTFGSAELRAEVQRIIIQKLRVIRLEFFLFFLFFTSQVEFFYVVSRFSPAFFSLTNYYNTSLSSNSTHFLISLLQSSARLAHLLKILFTSRACVFAKSAKK